MGREKTDADELIPFFMPSLSAVLLAEEDKKGSPLSKEEVLSIRDGATCIMMEIGDAERMHDSRGYRDIDPDNCWHDWQMLRREMEREPDFDPGPRFAQVRTGDPLFQATLEQAQHTLPAFRLALPEDGRTSAFALIKAEVSDHGGAAVMWLNQVARVGDSFSAELFELPDSLAGCRVGDRLTIDTDAVLDWMINDDGKIYGGFSLRYQRERLTEGERAQFDRYIGAIEYADRDASPP